MRLWLAAALAALFVGTLNVGASAGDGAPVYAAFETGRIKDDLRGVLPDADQEVTIRIHATAGSKLNATLTPNDEFGAAATGVRLELCEADGTSIPVTGTKADKSKDGKDQVKWKGVPLETTQDYILVVRVTTPGGYRLKLTGTIKAIVTEEKSTEPLFSGGAEASVAFEGLAQGKVKVALTPLKGEKLKGEVVRVEQDDGTIVWDGDDDDPGPILLEQNGMHRVFFVNNANVSGNWKAVVTAKPPKAKKRTGYVRPEGTALVPKVKKVDPDKGVHLDTHRTVSMTGRDFQDGMDVRLTRKERGDILATDIVVVSETEATFTLDLDTRNTQSENSVGKWKLAVFNAPVYGTPDDRTTLEKDSPTKNTAKSFNSITSKSVRLPRGVEKKTEVWYVSFSEGFGDDLDAMGFDSTNFDVQQAAREAVKAYTITYLRDLFRLNETDGTVKGKSVPVSFVIDEPTSVAGDPGVDYNRIEVGGAWEVGDPLDPDANLFWGFAPLDPGNSKRDDLPLEVEDDQVAKTRIGHGLRTAVLDPENASAATNWVLATAPLRNAPLGFNDRIFFYPGFAPRSQAEADRYYVITKQTERAAREIAALIAHQIGKAMGLDDGGSGPMQNPTEAGDLWRDYIDLTFSDGDVLRMQELAVEHELPGVSDPLKITYFPLNPTNEYKLPDLTTEVDYRVDFNFAGGRPNAVPVDYEVLHSSAFPLGLTADIAGIRGKAPLFLAQNVFYCDLSQFAIRVTDTKRGWRRDFAHRINVLPNVPLLPTALQGEATKCRDQVLAN